MTEPRDYWPKRRYGSLSLLDALPEVSVRKRWVSIGYGDSTFYDPETHLLYWQDTDNGLWALDPHRVTRVEYDQQQARLAGRLP